MLAFLPLGKSLIFRGIISRVLMYADSGLSPCGGKSLAAPFEIRRDGSVCFFERRTGRSEASPSLLLDLPEGEIDLEHADHQIHTATDRFTSAT